MRIISKIIKIVPGGITRQSSSYNAINSGIFSDEDILIFHDAARPFVLPVIINACIEAAVESDASGVYVKATDTIAEIDKGYVRRIPSREGLYYTQTPQAFKYKRIKEAHDMAVAKNIINATDDVSLIIDAGYKVKMVKGDYMNIKITSAFDLEIAKFILKM